MSRSFSRTVPCPQCAAKTRVVDSRGVTDSGGRVHGRRRRRECENQHRFSTVEVPITELERLRTIQDGARAIVQFAKQISEGTG